MLRIAVVGPTYPYRGGISHYTTLLYKELAKRHNVQFWSFLRQYPNWLFPGKSDKDFSDRNLKPKSVRYTLDSLLPPTWISTANEIIRFQPDMVLLPWWVAFWGPIFYVLIWQIKKHLSTKVVFICHNIVEHESASWKIQISRLALGLGDAFIVHSSEESDRLQHWYPDANVKRVFHPIYSLLPKRNISRSRAREQLNLSKSERLMLFFGFVRPYKGLQYLIQAMPQILKEIEATLLVVGEFWEDKSKYQKKIQELGLEKNIRIIDRYIPSSEIEWYFSAANVLVMPYVSVTGSGVVQMAYYFDTPVIVTDVGMLSEIVRNGRTGLIVPPQNPDALAKAVIRYFSNGLESRFRKEIKSDKKRFSWETIAKAIEEFN